MISQVYDMFVMRLARNTGHLLPPAIASQISRAMKNPPVIGGLPQKVILQNLL